MPSTALRHLAIIAGGTDRASRPPPGTVVEAVTRAAALASEAFAAAPELQAFSFVASGIDRLLDEPRTTAEALRECIEAARILEEAAVRSGAALRLCGRTDGLPEPLLRHAVRPPATAAGRTLLWYVRYRGRDEIARAAGEFFRARGDAALKDDDLDAWLDTSGLPDPDLVVLLGEHLEAPDALVWQGSYAELWHAAKPWSAFGAADLLQAMADYATRQRRFGG